MNVPPETADEKQRGELPPAIEAASHPNAPDRIELGYHPREFDGRAGISRRAMPSVGLLS